MSADTLLQPIVGPLHYGREYETCYKCYERLLSADPEHALTSYEAPKPSTIRHTTFKLIDCNKTNESVFTPRNVYVTFDFKIPIPVLMHWPEPSITHFGGNLTDGVLESFHKVILEAPVNVMKLKPGDPLCHMPILTDGMQEFNGQSRHYLRQHFTDQGDVLDRLVIMPVSLAKQMRGPTTEVYHRPLDKAIASIKRISSRRNWESGWSKQRVSSLTKGEDHDYDFE